MMKVHEKHSMFDQNALLVPEYITDGGFRWVASCSGERLGLERGAQLHDRARDRAGCSNQGLGQC